MSFDKKQWKEKGDVWCFRKYVLPKTAWHDNNIRVDLINKYLEEGHALWNGKSKNPEVIMKWACSKNEIRHKWPCHCEWRGVWYEVQEVNRDDCAWVVTVVFSGLIWENCGSRVSRS